MGRLESDDTPSTAELECADTVEGKTGARTSATADPPALERGDELAHFVILGTLGEGGMGVVYAAYDQRLDRKVAVKRMRSDHRDESIAQSRRRMLLREAQALARLNHPNVVAVHDVLEVEGRVYVAMEYVPGSTLSTWVRKQKRSWREIVDSFLWAGRGLAAAHRAGLIHRDFKPDNVLVGDDGRVRVTDLGLVLASDSELPEPVVPRSGRATTAVPLSNELTEHGDVVGTPGYVAPELYRGERANERADQFSFCVALYEALHGHKPFPGGTALEIVAASLRGELRDAANDSDVPNWIDAALTEGCRSIRRIASRRWTRCWQCSPTIHNNGGANAGASDWRSVHSSGSPA
jgi:serine/threonine protein kinase